MPAKNKMIPKTPYMPIDQFDPKQIQNIAENQADWESDPNALLSELQNTCSDAGREGFSYEVVTILLGMGMEKYIDLFKNFDVSLDTFLEMNYNDLNHLGITSPADQDIIINNLKDFKNNKLKLNEDVPEKHFVVHANSYEDFVIAKNVLNQIIFLQSYGSYTILQMKKNVLFDYFVSRNQTAVGILKLLSEQALLQSNRISNILFDGDINGNNLIASAIKESKKEIPPSLLEKLMVAKSKPKLKSKSKVKKIILTIVSVIGLPSLALLIGKKLAY